MYIRLQTHRTTSLVRNWFLIYCILTNRRKDLADLTVEYCRRLRPYCSSPRRPNVYCSRPRRPEVYCNRPRWAEVYCSRPRRPEVY